MPMLIEHIDAIARQKKRDVLFVQFHRYDDTMKRVQENDWETIRQGIIDWLEANGYAWQPCGHVASIGLTMSYQGQIYIDVPFDQNLPEYQKLASFLENPEGTMRIPGATFCCHRYASALKNAAHDEPGFWEKRAEDF